MASNVLTKNDYLRTSLRAYFIQNGFNYGNYQGLGYANMLYPALRKMYKDDDDALQAALQENLDFYNTNIHFVPFITSLHLVMLENGTPNNEIRSGMMPVNDAYPVEVLMQAVRRYQDTTGRRVSFEYSMVRGVNDSDACARQLANLIRGMGAHVNLIPINPVDGSPYSATDAANVHRFQQKLESLGVNATVRRRLGSEISAACGQLRRDEMNGKA